MQSNHANHTPSRAQGEQHLHWPAELPGAPETSCIALHVQRTQDRLDGDVDILLESPRVAVGEVTQTLRALIEYRFVGEARDTVLAEIDALGVIDPHCPLVLERLQEFDEGIVMHLEAVVLPVCHEQSATLADLLASEENPEQRHELGELWAEDLTAVWRSSADTRGLPVRFLEDAIPTQPSAALQPGAAMLPPARDHELLAAA